MQIRSRLTIQFTLLVITIVLISFFSVYYFSSQLTEREFDKRLKEKAVTTAVLLIRVDQIDSALLKVIDRAKRDNMYRENVVVLDSADRIIYVNNENFELQIDPLLFARVRSEREIHFHQGEFNVIGFLFQDKSASYVVVAGAENREGVQRLSDLRILLITLFVVMILIVALTGWVYSGRALRPIQKVMSQVQDISPQDLSKRLQQAEQPDEIGKLITIFNGMLSRIESAFSLQRTFVANVSHELKNPLTKVTSQLEVTLLKDRDQAEYKKMIASVLEDIKELNQLSNSLLELARLNRDESTFTMSRIRLDEIIWEAREDILQTDPSFQVIFEMQQMPEDDSKLYINGNQHLLKTAIRNVIENACKYSSDRKSWVSMKCDKNILTIEVLDKGPGISEYDLARILQPFYRADATSKTKGYGIGLSLSQRIISMHKGDLTIESKLEEGTVVRIAFVIPEF